MRRAAWLVLALLAGLAAPAAAYADKSFSISRAFVTVTVARNGEVIVREDLTFDYSGFFTGAYRDIPLATGRPGGRRPGQRGRHGIRARRQHRRSAAATPSARFGAVRMPQGLRIVWHYQQNGGQRTYTLRYRLRGVVIAHDDAVEVAPAGLGRPVGERAPAAARERPGGGRAGRHARLDRARLARASRQRAAAALVLTATEDVPSQARRDPARALPAVRARAERAVCAPRARRRARGDDRARAGG